MKTFKTTMLLALLVLPLVPVSTSAQKTQAVASGETAGAAHKLDPQLVMAVKQYRQGTSGDRIMPSATISVREGDMILVDVTAKVSDDLRGQVTKLGGKLIDSPDPHHVIRAMVPLKQMEALANRSDVESIVPAQITYTSGAKPKSR